MGRETHPTNMLKSRASACLSEILSLQLYVVMGLYSKNHISCSLWVGKGLVYVLNEAGKLMGYFWLSI